MSGWHLADQHLFFEWVQFILIELFLLQPKAFEIHAQMKMTSDDE